MKKILKGVRSLSADCWRSFERSFYTLQLRAYINDKLSGDQRGQSDETIIKDFARCVQSLLRKAHGKRVCEHHQKFLSPLEGSDTIISFNYDLVVERALRPTAEVRKVSFSPGIYGLGAARDTDLPRILKVHGSSNWKIAKSTKFESRTQSWEDFDETPGYRGHIGSGSSFPIFLPFWDKRIEQQPWLGIWREAFKRLQTSGRLIVWGYSLPATDIKAQTLFTLALGKKAIDLCVIDPSASTRERWRQLLPRARYWEYDSIKDFFQEPPAWWPDLAEELE